MMKETKRSIAKQIGQGALLEQTYRRTARRYDESVTEITQKPFEVVGVYKYIVNLHDEPVSVESFESFDPDVVATRGQYTISYIPLKSRFRNPKFPYLIGQDLVRIRITVSGPAHWGMVCKRVPEFAWLNRNTDVMKLFRIAKMHPGLTIRFGIKFPEYCEKIEKRAEELGMDIDHKPLVSYAWDKTFAAKYGHKELNPKRTKQDYETVLSEVEQSDSVQNEIKGVK